MLICFTGVSLTEITKQIADAGKTVIKQVKLVVQRKIKINNQTFKLYIEGYINKCVYYAILDHLVFSSWKGLPNSIFTEKALTKYSWLTSTRELFPKKINNNLPKASPYMF